MALIDKSSIVIPKGFYGKANVLQGFNPQTENLVDLDVVRNTTATRVNENGLIESVAANVPRIDYLNGGCGELLVEEQRTNLATYSENFSNASWLKVLGAGGGSAPTISSNHSIAPDGANTADKLTINGAQNRIEKDITVTSGTDASLSIFVKKTGSGTSYDYVRLLCLGSGSDLFRAWFNVTNGTLGTNNAVGTAVLNSATIKEIGDYYEISISGSLPTFPTYTFFFTIADADGSNNSPVGAEAHIWGAQTEEGSYASSYIPTTASAVTRNQDVISASNINSLLGDSEGGLFVEAAPFEVSTNLRFSLSDGSMNNRVSITYFSSPQYFVVAGGVMQVGAPTSGTATANAFSKITLRYATNDFAVYQDGSSVFTQGTGTTFSNGALTDLRFDNGTGTANFYGRIRQLVVFDNAPTDTEMQTLTTP